MKDKESGRNACSERCQAAITRQAIVRETQLVSFRLLHSSNKGGSLTLKMMSVVCLITSTVELFSAFVLVHYIPGFHSLSRVSACGIAGFLVLSAVVCSFGSKALTPVLQKADDLLGQLDS